MDVCVTSFPFSDFFCVILGKFRSYEEKIIGTQCFWWTGCWLATESFNTGADTYLWARNLVLLRKFLAASLPFEMLCILGYVSGAMSFSQSLKDTSRVRYLMIGQTPICLEAWPLQFPQQWYPQCWSLCWLNWRIWHCFVQPFTPTPVNNLTLGWCFHNRQSQICFDFAFYHHCAEQSAHQFLLL